MNRFKNYVWMAGFAILVAVVSGITAGSAVAQAVKAALVRDIDTPALAPLRAGGTLNFAALNDSQLVTAVPVGKRLVIEHMSYQFSGVPSNELIEIVLRNGQFGQFRHNLEIHPQHATLIPTSKVQEGSQAVKDYFEAGEQVWVNAVHTDNAGTLQWYLTGYFVTP